MQNEKKLQLSKEEISQLFRFVESKYVRYKDVQYEIVDHLASGIEEKQEKNPEVGFQEALHEIYQNFPITGFADLIKEKQESLLNFWLRSYKQAFKRFFTLPFFLYVVAIFLGFISLLTSIQFKIVLFNFLFLIIPFVVVFQITRIRHESLYKKRNQFLILQTYFGSIWTYVGLFIFPICFSQSIKLTIVSTSQIILFSALGTFNFTYMYLILMAFPQLLESELKEKYKHLQIS